MSSWPVKHMSSQMTKYQSFRPGTSAINPLGQSPPVASRDKLWQVVTSWTKWHDKVTVEHPGQRKYHKEIGSICMKLTNKPMKSNEIAWNRINQRIKQRIKRIDVPRPTASVAQHLDPMRQGQRLQRRARAARARARVARAQAARSKTAATCSVHQTPHKHRTTAPWENVYIIQSIMYTVYT